MPDTCSGHGDCRRGEFAPTKCFGWKSPISRWCRDAGTPPLRASQRLNPPPGGLETKTSFLSIFSAPAHKNLLIPELWFPARDAQWVSQPPADPRAGGVERGWENPPCRGCSPSCARRTPPCSGFSPSHAGRTPPCDGCSPSCARRTLHAMGAHPAVPGGPSV